MKILVTGATGFLGSYIVKALIQNGHEVIILKRSFSNTRRIQEELAKVIAYNVDQYKIEQVFKEHNDIDAVIHTATCYGRRGETICMLQDANTVFPLSVLEGAIASGVNLFINTDTVLDKNLNYYSLTKGQFLEIGKKLADEGKIKFINLKLEHFYGPGDDDSKFISYVIKQCRNNIAELNLTKGEQKRDFVYIDDVVNAYMLFLNNLKSKGNFNEYQVGTGKSIAIRELVLLIYQLTAATIKLNFGAVPYRKNELIDSCANIDKLEKMGWKPQLDVESGIRKTLKLQR